MLADPGGIQSYLFGVDRLVEDVGDDLIGAAPIVLIVVVAEREVAEFHFWVPLGMNSRRAIRDFNSCLDISSEPIKPPLRRFPSQPARWAFARDALKENQVAFSPVLSQGRFPAGGLPCRTICS